MALHDPPSAGEIGGIFAGIIALLATIGGGVRWLFGWRERRAETFHAKLLSWEAKLDAREARLDTEQAGLMARLERRVLKVERHCKALSMSYDLVSSELRFIDPENARLRQAEELLRIAIPVDPEVPPNLEGLLDPISTNRIDD